MRERETSRRPFGYHLGRRKETVGQEIDEELRLHLELRAEELRASGMSEEAARREALLRFGDLEQTRRYCKRQDLRKERSMRRGLMLADLLQDLRICVRGLLRAPATTLAIVATVSLGIGATTAIFAAVRAALFLPLPYAEPERLVRIYTDAPPYKFRFSVADWLALNEQQTHFERIGAYREREMTWSDGVAAERLQGREVSWTYFSLLGIRPALGSDFTEADGRPGAPPAVIVSDALWKRHLDARDDAVGGVVRLDGVDYAVAGVLPEKLGPLERQQDFFVAGRWDTPPRKGPFFLITMGRLRPDVSREAAADELRAINRRIFPLWKVSYQDESATWGLMDLRKHVTGEVGTAAGIALGAVAVVWLIACANASNLLVARVASRRRELSVRAALGAGRGRVVRHLLTECALLALGSAAGGIALAWAGVVFLRSFGRVLLPRSSEISLDGPVLWVLAGLTLASLVLFGLAPALQGSGGPVDDGLRSTVRGSAGGLRARRLRRALVGSQFAIATPLLVVAGLLAMSLSALGRVDLGFERRGLLSGTLSLPQAQVPEPARVAAFFDELQRRLAALPGVSGVAFADGRPPVEVNNFNNFDLEEFPTPPDKSQPVTPWIAVTPDYFRLLGLTHLEGRLFDERDGRTLDLESVVVDEAWATRFFPNESPLGKRFRNGGCTTCPWTTVVGVVSNVKYAGLASPDEGSVYTPMAMGPPALEGEEAEEITQRYRYLFLRTDGDALALAPDVERIVREIDPTVPVADLASVDELVAQSLLRPRSLSFLVAAFAIVALLLSVVGIYGVMAHYAQQQSREIGIRVALGGSSRDVLGLVVGQGMRVVASGVVVGLVVALLVTRWMTSLLYGVGAGDALTFASVGAFLGGVALLACLLPARRAAVAPPAAVLRTD